MEALLALKAAHYLNHQGNWHSQPITNGTAAGNVLLAGAILFEGASLTQIMHLLGSLNILVFAKCTY